MSLRMITTLITFCFVFFGLLSMVGNVHVAEFYGIIGISFILSIIIWFKLGRLSFMRKKVNKDDFL